MTPLPPTRPPQVGDPAPDWTLPDQTGTPVHLAALLARGPVVLYFYPKDNTTGCTAEACGFRDAYAAFVDAGAQVVGVSADSVATHAGFAARHHLPFILCSDAGNRVRRAYGVPATAGLLPGRVTYVIDSAGRIRHRFNSQLQARRHIRELLAVIRGLTAGEVPEGGAP